MLRRSLVLAALLVLGLVSTFVVPSAASIAVPTCEVTMAGEPVAGAECTVTGSAAKVGSKTFEPTMGASTDGSLWFATTPGSGVAVGFGASISRSTDGGKTWADKGPKVAGRGVPLETNDPYIYVDPGTGRIFQFHMAPILTCASLSFSDDAGESWTTQPIGCGPTGAWDHQTMVAAKPRVLTPVGYPNILHQCVNAVYAEMCSRSLDGGLTWSPSNVAWANDSVSKLCGTQTGHLAAGPDGTLYLPTSDCAKRPTVAVSRDDGLTWTRVPVTTAPMPFEDPAVAVDADGNAYVAWPDNNGQLWFSVSRDKGATWSAPIRATSTDVTAAKVSMTVGDSGKIAIAYVGSSTIPGQIPGKAKLNSTDAKNVRWGAFFTTSLNALDPSPTFTTVEATGTDPLFNTAAACGPGLRCSYVVDFIGSTVTPDGTPYGSFVDGCTSTACSKGVGVTNNESGTTGQATAVWVDVDLCEARCPRFGAAPTAGASTASAAPPVFAPQTGSTAPRPADEVRAGLLRGGPAQPTATRG